MTKGLQVLALVHLGVDDKTAFAIIDGLFFNIF